MRWDPAQTKRPYTLWVLIGVAAALVLALGYAGYQAYRILNPPNLYETALMSTVEDTVEAEGVLLFQETLVPGSGLMGYRVGDGERVSAGTVVAEVYSDASQSALRARLTDLYEQIDLLEHSENVSTTQIDALLAERSGALYTLLDNIDRGLYSQIDDGRESYLLAQNRLWVTTGEAADFSAQIAALSAEATQLEGQLGGLAQVVSPGTGYFVRSGTSRQLTQSADAILALDAAGLKALLDQQADTPLEGCAGKIVSGFSWYYCGVCTAEQGQKLLGRDGAPLTGNVQIRFPGQTESSLKAKITEVTIDEASGLARFVLRCDTLTGEVLRLGQANAEIILSETTGLRIKAEAVHYLLEETGEEVTALQGENYIPGVYVKFGNLARFCRIDPVDSDHPLVQDGDYIIVQPKGTANSVSELKLYDTVIVSGQNLYDGKLLY